MELLSKLTTLSVVVTLATGCALPADPQDSSETSAPTEDSSKGAQDAPAKSAPAASNDSEVAALDTVFMQTIVTMTEDGSEQVTSEPITLAQEIEENRIREMIADGIRVPQTRALDSSCNGNSEWLYDQPSFVGNRICFSHPGDGSNRPYVNIDEHDLASYPRGSYVCGSTTYTTYWAGGISGCTPVFTFPPNGSPPRYLPTYRSDSVNSVRSIWTGTSPSPGDSGVWFNDEAYGGPPFYLRYFILRASFPGSQVQYPNETPTGRFVTTKGVARIIP